jgi:hypothetical protein
MRGEVGARDVTCHPLGLPPLLYKVEVSSSHTLSLPPPAAPLNGDGLGKALPKLFLHHHHLVELLLEFPVDPLLPPPRWNEGTEVVIELNV